MRVKTKLFTALVGMGVSVFAGVANAIDISTSPHVHEIEFQLEVPATCTLDTSSLTTSNAGNGGFDSSTLSAGESTFVPLLSGTTAEETTGTLTIGDVSCSSGNVTVTMTPDDWINNGAGEEIRYQAIFVIGGGYDNTSYISKDDTTPSVASTTIVNPTTTAAARVGVEITTKQTSGLPSGTYTGSLTINISPSA